MDYYPQNKTETGKEYSASIHADRQIINDFYDVSKQPILHPGNATNNSMSCLGVTENSRTITIEASAMNRGQKPPHVSTEYGNIAVPNFSCCAVAPVVHPYQQIFLQASNIGRSRVATNSHFEVPTKQPFLMMGGTTENSAHPRLLIQTQHGPALLLSPIETSDVVAQQRQANRLANTSNATATTDRKTQRWSKEEDAILKKATRNESGPKYAWAHIAQKYFSNSRTAIQCKTRWTKSLHPGIVRGGWKKEEDSLILKLRAGDGLKWSSIADHLPGRRGEQIRDRYVNKLDRNLKKAPWTLGEGEILFQEQRRIGNKWTQIANLLPGRSENTVKNRWYNLSKTMRQHKSKENIAGERTRVTKKKLARSLSGNTPSAVVGI